MLNLMNYFLGQEIRWLVLSHSSSKTHFSFRIPQPNKFKIIHMDIPIVRFSDPDTGEVKEDMVFCTDILDALTQDFFARKGNPIEDPPQVEEVKVGLFKQFLR